MKFLQCTMVLVTIIFLQLTRKIFAWSVSELLPKYLRKNNYQNLGHFSQLFSPAIPYDIQQL